MLKPGTLGTAILSGVFESLASVSSNSERPSVNIPTRYIACVTRPESAKRVTNTLQQYRQNLDILVDDNLAGVQQADVVILACKPYHYRDVLSATGMKEALSGKFLISVLAGVQATDIEKHIHSDIFADASTQNKCRIVNVLPNTAAAIRESMTYISKPTPPLSSEQDALVDWIFNQIGHVVHLAPNLFDAATALCGSGPAFMAIVLEALADGGVAKGIPRADALRMAAQVMRGAATLVLDGEHPAVVKDKVCSPGGCSIAGVLVVEDGKVRSTISRAVGEATDVASRLGKPKS